MKKKRNFKLNSQRTQRLKNCNTPSLKARLSRRKRRTLEKKVTTIFKIGLPQIRLPPPHPLQNESSAKGESTEEFKIIRIIYGKSLR